jgi:hypothetical protein
MMTAFFQAPSRGALLAGGFPCLCSQGRTRATLLWQGCSKLICNGAFTASLRAPPLQTNFADGKLRRPALEQLANVKLATFAFAFAFVVALLMSCDFELVHPATEKPEPELS